MCLSCVYSLEIISSIWGRSWCNSSGCSWLTLADRRILNMSELLLHISHSVWWEGRGLGRYLVHSSPSVLTHLVQQMDHGGRGVTPQPCGEVTQLWQRVKKDSLVLLMAALAPLLCSMTPGSEVRAQLWLRNWGHQAAGEMWAGETVPLSSARDPWGSALAFCLSALCPAFGSGLAHSYPFTSAHQETQGLKSVEPEGLKEKISFAE